MKRIILFLLLAFLLWGFTGCSTTRKAAKSTADSHITATQEEERRTEDRQQTEVTSSTEISDRTNVVIEFTKVEYRDGSEDIATAPPGQPTGRTTTRSREGRSKPPDTESGVKSVTTGKITINGDRSGTTETTVTEESGKTTGEHTNTAIQADQKQEGATEETKKPKSGLSWGICLIMAVVCGIAFFYICRKRD